MPPCTDRKKPVSAYGPGVFIVSRTFQHRDRRKPAVIIGGLRNQRNIVINIDLHCFESLVEEHPDRPDEAYTFVILQTNRASGCVELGSAKNTT